MPHPSRTKGVLIDASSAILLHKAALIGHFSKAFHLFVTPAVYKKVVVPSQPGADALRALIDPHAGIALLPDPDGPLPEQSAAALNRLHSGERDTLCHYVHGVGRFVVIDDGKGVRQCRILGIPHVNALLCPALLTFSVLKIRCRRSITGAGWYDSTCVGRIRNRIPVG